MRSPVAPPSWENFEAGPQRKTGPLEKQMGQFLDRHEGHSAYMDEEIPLEGKLQESSGHRQNLLGAIRHFEQTLKNFKEISESRMPLSRNAIVILDEARRLLGPEYCNELAAYLAKLLAINARVIAGVEEMGLGYLIQRERCNEKVAQDLEDASIQMMEANKHKYRVAKIHDLQEEERMPEIMAKRTTNLVDAFIGRNPKAAAKRHLTDSALYQREVEDLGMIFETLRAEYSPGAVKDDMVDLANHTMDHLSLELGPNVLSFARKMGPEGARRFDEVKSPLIKIEFVIEGTRCLIQEASSLKRQSELVLGEMAEESEGQKSDYA